MPLATQPNVEALLLRLLTADEVTHLPVLAGFADTEILAELPGFTLEQTVEVDVVAELGRDLDVWTPLYPVISVEAVTVEGTPLDLDHVEHDPYGPITLCGRPASTYNKGLAYSWTAGDSVTLSYTAGFAPEDVPAELQLVAAEAVAMALTGPRGGVRQEQLGDHMVGYAAGAAGGRVRLDAEQRRKVRRFRREITSLALRRAGA